MNLHKKIIEDTEEAGFHVLDPEVLKPNPPKIKWSDLYKNEWGQDKKIKYLEKLASAMNHAAAQIQQQRDWFSDMCSKKEKQIEAYKVECEQNNALLQSEITRMNEDRQLYNKAIADLNDEMRALKNGNNG